MDEAVKRVIVAKNTHPLVRALPDGAARELILKAFLDAHYGPATSKRCVRRFSVPPLPGHAAHSSGSFHVGAEPAAGGAGGSASRSRSRSRSPTKGRRKSMRRASNDPPAELS